MKEWRTGCARTSLPDARMAGSDSLVRVFRTGAVYRGRPEKHRAQRRDRWNASRRYDVCGGRPKVVCGTDCDG